MDRGAWRAVVHRVTKNWTLRQLSTHAHINVVIICTHTLLCVCVCVYIYIYIYGYSFVASLTQWT